MRCICCGWVEEACSSGSGHVENGYERGDWGSGPLLEGVGITASSAGKTEYAQEDRAEVGTMSCIVIRW